MAMYTKQGLEKGSFEAYEWFINNYPSFDIRVENRFTLFYLAHKMINGAQDAMLPYDFANAMTRAHLYLNLKTKKTEEAPAWYRAQNIRAQIVAEQYKRIGDRKKMVDALRAKEEFAAQVEPMRARQLAWENKRWLDYTPEQIQECTEFLPDKVFPEYVANIQRPVVYKIATPEGYHIWVYEKMNGHYMGILFNPNVNNGYTFDAMRRAYNELCERCVENLMYESKRLPEIKKSVTRVRKQSSPDIKNVRQAMGLTEENFPDELNQNNLF